MVEADTLSTYICKLKVSEATRGRELSVVVRTMHYSKYRVAAYEKSSKVAEACAHKACDRMSLIWAHFEGLSRTVVG